MKNTHTHTRTVSYLGFFFAAKYKLFLHESHPVKVKNVNLTETKQTWFSIPFIQLFFRSLFSYRLHFYTPYDPLYTVVCIPDKKLKLFHFTFGIWNAILFFKFGWCWQKTATFGNQIFPSLDICDHLKMILTRPSLI